MMRQLPPAVAITDKYSMLLEDDKCIVGASSMQGWRPSQEDAHTVFLSLPRLKNLHEDDGAIFAVFDGHCGTRCAQLCATNIVHWLCQSESYLQGDYARGLFDAFLYGDASLRTSLGRDTSGCAAIVTLIVEKNLYCASAGDSRAMLCRNGEAMVLTDDHKPTLPAEKKRIEMSGGFVMNGRVNGVLALSRAFGDFPLKDEALAPQHQAVTVVPSVTTVTITKDDEFLLIGCDGIFEKKTNDEVVAFVRQAILRQRSQGQSPDMSRICEELMMECLGPAANMKGSDNMSIIIIQLKDTLAGNGLSAHHALGPSASTSPPANGSNITAPGSFLVAAHPPLPSSVSPPGASLAPGVTTVPFSSLGAASGRVTSVREETVSAATIVSVQSVAPHPQQRPSPPRPAEESTTSIEI